MHLKIKTALKRRGFGSTFVGLNATHDAVPIDLAMLFAHIIEWEANKTLFIRICKQINNVKDNLSPIQNNAVVIYVLYKQIYLKNTYFLFSECNVNKSKQRNVNNVG